MARAARHTDAPEAELLKGWKVIAEFLGQPVTTVKRWAEEGMPVERQGRYVAAEPARLSEWLGRESGVGRPVHIAPGGADLSRDLKDALAAARRKRKIHRVK